MLVLALVLVLVPLHVLAGAAIALGKHVSLVLMHNTASELVSTISNIHEFDSRYIL